MKKMLPLKYQMRKKEWEIQDRNNMEQLLARVKVGRMGLYDGEEPYIVPVLFAYKNNQIYIHSAPEGRKIEILKSYPRICFEVSEFLRYDPIKQFTSYRSVLCFGNVSFLTTNNEPAYLEALELIIQKYEPGRKLSCTEGALVLRLDVDMMTGRERIQD